MFNKDIENETQINQILNIIKIASLSFPAIAFLQYFSSFSYNNSIYFIKYGVLIISVLSVILLIYILWTLLQSKLGENYRFKKWVDPVVSLSIAFLSVMLTGSYQSNYKFLFLLVIIASSIECSMKAGIAVSGLSAATVLGIDLVCAPKTDINTYFESDIVLACVFLIISWTIGYYVNLRRNILKV